jgi:protein-tyrosine-phosphatase
MMATANETSKAEPPGKPGSARTAALARRDSVPGDPPVSLRFVCPADPSRAFIAEAFVRGSARGGAAGRADGDPARVHPAARRVMQEIGIPLRESATNAPSARDGASELVVVIGNRGVPHLSGAMSWRFDDPSQGEDEATRLMAFRRVRDEIKRRVDLLLLVVKRRWLPQKSDEARGGNA